MLTLKDIQQRIENKIFDYNKYNFSKKEVITMMTFFDLAQEYGDIKDLYTLCVAIPKAFFNLDARLYLIDPVQQAMQLVSKTEGPENGLYESPPDNMIPTDKPYCMKNSIVFTIRGKERIADRHPSQDENNSIGMLELYPVKDMPEDQIFFFGKYTNRIGFNIHNRFLDQRNIEHLNFIRTLVADIEHNIIVPNMVYKLFLRRMKGKIEKNLEIEQNLLSYANNEVCDETCMARIIDELREVNYSLQEEFRNIEKHYQSTTLFLETLLRKSHFDKGHLTLRTKRCNMKKDVILPQLERYSERFSEAGITVNDKPSGIYDEDLIAVVDVGLIAQVYANFFSNALKYTNEVITDSGEKVQYMACGSEILKDYFGDGKDGIKYNVFTTGQHIKPEERENIFSEGYRGSNTSAKPGTGQGLTFIKNAIKIHGGVVEYEPVKYGNNFCFILPIEQNNT